MTKDSGTAEPERWDAVVIGSGFGGSITAHRLALAGKRVLVLERGKHYRPGEFPRDLTRVDEVLWRFEEERSARGLFDVRFFSGVTAVSAAGVGGGSLVYANIHYRPRPEIFDDARWPAEVDLDWLEPYYQRVTDKLALLPVPEDEDIPKRNVFNEAGRQMGRECFDAPQAVSWEKLAGIITSDREPCQRVSECEFGCNHGAKNSLDFNYLGEAIEQGATLRAECWVSHLAPAEDGWAVHFEDTTTGEKRVAVGARVVVGAGTVGSNELLLRSRDVTRTLPDLPARLGHGYSGNGDFLGTVQHIKDVIHPHLGPDVTSVMWFFDTRPGFALAAPAFAMPAMEVLASFGQRPPGWLMRTVGPLLYRSLGRLLPWAARKGKLSKPMFPPGKGAGEPERMANLFAIGEDNAGGRMHMRGSELDVAWDYEKENRALIARQEAGMRELAETWGGRYANLPSWDMFKRITTVHNLGGCAMADSPETGVVSTRGEVFGHAGLYVADGSIIPTAIGSHPVMTISALAEHIGDCIVQSFD